MGLRYTPQSTGPRFNPCDVDIVVAILDDCRHRWIGGHNVFEVVFIRKYYNLIEPRRGKTHRCSHRPHPLHLPPRQGRALLSGLSDLLCGILALIRNKSPKSCVQFFLRTLRLLMSVKHNAEIFGVPSDLSSKLLGCDSGQVHLAQQVSGLVLFETLQELLEDSATNLTFLIATNRGKAFQKTLELPAG